MKTIRYGVFETNSSSTHSLIICTDEEYQKWIDGEMILDRDFEKIAPMPSDFELEEDSWRYVKYDEFDDKISQEPYHEEYTTPHNDKIHVFGWYGYDG